MPTYHEDSDTPNPQSPKEIPTWVLIIICIILVGAVCLGLLWAYGLI